MLSWHSLGVALGRAEPVEGRRVRGAEAGVNVAHGCDVLPATGRDSETCMNVCQPAEHRAADGAPRRAAASRWRSNRAVSGPAATAACSLAG
jgi:hypothetical protein